MSSLKSKVNEGKLAMEERVMEAKVTLSKLHVGQFSFNHKRVLVKKLTLQNFEKLFSNDSVIPFKRWWLNTFIVATASCVNIPFMIVFGD